MEIDYHEFEFLDSTQKWAKKHLAKLHPKRLSIISAKSQQKGYGRSGLKWVSPPGNLYISFVFFTPPLPFLHRTTQWVALMASECLHEHSIDSLLKWPNDLIVQGKKIGGALTEVEILPSGMGVIAGLGVNVKHHPLELPSTSMEAELNATLNLHQVSRSLIKKISSTLPLYLSQGFAPFHNRFEKAFLHKFQDTLRFKERNQLVEGVFLGFNESGALLLKKENGEIVHSFNGRVE